MSDFLDKIRDRTLHLFHQADRYAVIADLPSAPGQVATWDGSKWVHAAPSGGSGSSGVLVDLASGLSSEMTLSPPSGPATIDDHAVSDGDRVLLTRQTVSADRGIWIANTAGPWTRPADWADGAVIPDGLPIFVGLNLGDVYSGGAMWVAASGTVGADQANFTWATPPLYSFTVTDPLPFQGVSGLPPVWSTTALNGKGGWVQDARMQLEVQYHSTADAADIVTSPPIQFLEASWIDTGSDPRNFGGIIGYVDHIPAGGHAGPQLTYIGPVAGQSFDITFTNRSTYGVVRLDGSASCVVSAKAATIDPSLAGGSYNADSTMMDWAGASVKGTDLAADATNHWIHSTAGGLVFIFSTLAISPVGGDHPPFPG